MNGAIAMVRVSIDGGEPVEYASGVAAIVAIMHELPTEQLNGLGWMNITRTIKLSRTVTVTLDGKPTEHVVGPQGPVASKVVHSTTN